MMDIGGLSAASVVWPVPATARSAITDTATGSTGNDGATLTDRARQAEATARTLRPVDPDLPTGPPPTFTTTPLELEGDWQVILARLSAAGYALVQAMVPDAGAITRGKATDAPAGVLPLTEADVSSLPGSRDVIAPKSSAAIPPPAPGPRAP